MPGVNIFLTGATGYIGGSFLTILLKYPKRYTITALARNKDQADALKKLGVTPVIGSLDDTELLFKLAKESDAVVHTAHADHMPAIQALIKGLKARNDKNAVLLHTSGTGVLTFSGGPTEVPYDDKDMKRIHSIPITAPHKDVDTWIFDNTQDITAAIIAPSTINGMGTGLFKKSSRQVPALIKAAVARKEAGWVGPRADVIWGNVNINDLAELYHLVLDGLLSNTIQSGKQGGWYFGSSNEHTWVKVAEQIGLILHRLGIANTPATSPFEKEMVENHLYGEAYRRSWQGDSRCVANRSKEIGWKPCHPNIYETLEQEIKYLLENEEL